MERKDTCHENVLKVAAVVVAEVGSLTYVTDLFHDIKPILLVLGEYVP